MKSLVGYWRRQPERTRGYVVAAAAVLAAAGAALVLREYIDQRIFILFTAPIVLSAWYGGRGPAMAAMLFGLAALDLIFLDRVYFVVPASSHDLVVIAIYVGVGYMIAHISSLLRRARDDANHTARLLQDQAMELELQAADLAQQTAEAHRMREELAEAHDALKIKSQTLLAEAQALARLGSWDWNIETKTITWSDEMYRLCGLEPGSVEIDYESYQHMLHPDDRAHAAEAVNQSLATGAPFSFDHRIIRSDGEERIFHAQGKVIHDGDRSPARMIGTAQDVTEVRRASASLRTAAEYAARQATAEAAAQHLNRVFAQAPVAIAVLSGPEHRFELVNDKTDEIISRPLLGRTVLDALPELAAQGFVQLLDACFANDRPYVGQEIFATLDPSGPGAYFNFVFQPLSDDTGVYALLVVATDVSDLVRARIAAEQAQKEAVAASRAKSDFLARMSHELRTPLAAIIGYGELLADGITGPVNAEQKRQLGRIRSSADHLLSIIDEILTLARMEAGKERVDVHDVNVEQLMDSVASMAQPLAAAKGLTFSLGCTPAGATIRTDPVKVRQVMLNLLSNAVKYTDHGCVTVTAEVNDGSVHFLVTDTGVGVGAEHLEKIFEPFWQVEHTTTRRTGGTGLGLAVTRQFVDLLGGTISVSSKLGYGSTFSVTLPVSPHNDGGVAS